LTEARAFAAAGHLGAAALSTLSWLVITAPVVGIGIVLVRSLLHLARALQARQTALHAAPSLGQQEEPMTLNPTTELEAGAAVVDPVVADPVASSASSFTEEKMLRPRPAQPRHGWRRTLYVATNGRINVGPSAAERREEERASRVRTSVRGPRRVVVLSRKGGVGKTTTALMLGHTFAVHRGDRVVALDANPDAGSLIYRVRRESPETVTSLLGERELVSRYADIRNYTSQTPSRLEVVASDDDPRITQVLTDRDYRDAMGLLERHYSLLLIDTGTGILDNAVQGILREADQIVVVMPPALDGARVAAATLDWLDQHGHPELVETAVAVINATRGTARWVDLDLIEKHFAARCAGTVRIPWDPVLEIGAQADLDDLRPATRDAYLELAEAVAAGFCVDRSSR
jgi:putative peptide zinc metalloprotease protein